MNRKENWSGADEKYTKKDMEQVRQALETQEREEKEIRKVEKRTKKVNREIRIASVCFTLMFLAVIGYFSYFMIVKSGSTVNSAYNARLDTFSEKVVRGEIRGSGGEVLARTTEDSEGNEIREYPYANLFAHIVGYSDAGQTGLEASASQYLLTTHLNLMDQVSNETQDIKNPADNVVTTHGIRTPAACL